MIYYQFFLSSATVSLGPLHFVAGMLYDVMNTAEVYRPDGVAAIYQPGGVSGGIFTATGTADVYGPGGTASEVHYGYH